MEEDSSGLIEPAQIATSSPVVAALDEMTDDAMLESEGTNLVAEPAAPEEQLPVNAVQPLVEEQEVSKPNDGDVLLAQSHGESQSEAIEQAQTALTEEKTLQDSAQAQVKDGMAQPSVLPSEDTVMACEDLSDGVSLPIDTAGEIAQPEPAIQPDHINPDSFTNSAVAQECIQPEVPQPLSSEQMPLEATLQPVELVPSNTEVLAEDASTAIEIIAAVSSSVQVAGASSIEENVTVNQPTQPVASSSKKRPAEPTIGGLIASKKVRQQFKTPFKAPGKTKPAMPLATSTNEAPSSSKKRPLVTATPQKVSLLKTVHSPFRSPIAKPTSNVDSPIALSSELRRLEQRASILRSAVQVKKANEAGSQESDDRLVELIDKWKEASREGAKMLWDLSGASGMDPVEAVRAVSGSNGNSWGGSFESSWGLAKSDATFQNEEERRSKEDDEDLPEVDEVSKSERGARRLAAMREGKVLPATLSQASAEEEEEKPVARWNTGKMLKQMGIDPETLGWQSEEEDFADQKAGCGRARVETDIVK